jgi:hypothetical protein
VIAGFVEPALRAQAAGSRGWACVSAPDTTPTAHLPFEEFCRFHDAQAAQHDAKGGPVEMVTTLRLASRKSVPGFPKNEHPVSMPASRLPTVTTTLSSTSAHI